MNINRLDDLTITDTYSLIMFALYKLKDDPKYSTLSELTYLVDKNSFLALIEYFGGLTITIPTSSEVRLLLNALVMYDMVNVKKEADLTKLIRDFEKKGYDKQEIIDSYKTVCDVMSNYDFGDRI